MEARPLFPSPATGFHERRAWKPSTRWLRISLITIGLIVIGGTIGLKGMRRSVFSGLKTAPVSDDNLDSRLQRAATAALGDRRGTIIIMDAQTGRIRAVVNPKLAFEENLPPGSTIKPFTALAALRSGIIDDETRTLCGEQYSHDQFHTVCSHPRDLTPLNPTEAIAYSCNYYFGKVGERLDEASFISTLGEFGFGRKTGANVAAESQGKLPRNGWQSENAIGESEDLQATPIQLINAYSALVNGGHLFVPQISAAQRFMPRAHTELAIKDEHQRSIVKGMRGAVRYGTAETASLYSLPNYIFGKTGTATQINGFRTQGWFVGFASDLQNVGAEDSDFAPERVKLAVLVFLTRAHGSDAAKVARPIFDEYLLLSQTTKEGERGAAGQPGATLSSSSHFHVSPSLVRVHLVRENVTRAMPLEDYVRGVVAAEGSTESQPEALKALAVVSRTYALKNIGRHAHDGYDFCSTTHCQRFPGTDPRRNAAVSAVVIEAVQATAGEAIRDHSNQVAGSYFSASCGGATANVTTLWGGSAALHLRGVSDEYCASEAHHSWTDVISHLNLLNALKSDPRTNAGARLLDVRVFRRDESGRAELISIKGDRQLTVKGWDFKIIVGRALGWSLLKSSRFEIGRSGSDFVFRGSGFGHGLGLCQEGAHVMAARGASYRQILTKYFPATRIEKDDALSASTDLIWNYELLNVARSINLNSYKSAGRTRQTLASENFRINYPSAVSQREVESLLTVLQSSRRTLAGRIAAAGLNAQLPALEIFINETTGDFVGRTGQPPWVAAATKGNRIELQPLPTLKRRQVLESTLRHELVHTFVDALGRGRAPRWLAEGLAIHFAGEGRLVAGYEPRSRLAIQALEQKLTNAKSAEEMRAAYAAAYGEVRRLIANEGEASAWRRVANSH